MWFRGSPANHAARIVAALIVMAFSLVFLARGGPALLVCGLLLAALGLAALLHAAWQVAQARRDHPDPYDLSRLWEQAPEEDEPEEDVPDGDLLYCHHCGAAMSEVYSLCPSCGRHLGY